MTISLLAGGVALTAWRLAALPTPPHIITILTDDQGFGDNSYNCENSTAMCAQTPSLDALATSPHSALFWRFYSAAGVCSPTRAAYLTGRTNERSCIHFALTCDSENPAEECSQGPGLPWSEFTTAKAVKKAGGFKSIMIGKWHLGDLWDKHKPDAPVGAAHPRRAHGNEWTKGGAPWGDYSAPTNHGFDDFLQTQAEASNSMPNCGCFPVNHTNPGPKPPSGYRNIKPDGDQCVVGGGYASDWAYPCTDYFYPNSTDPRGVTGLHDVRKGANTSAMTPGRVPGNDAEFIVDRFLTFMRSTLSENLKFYAHLTFHAIHEPHPAMPEFYRYYKNDPDYLGALTMFDGQLGRLIRELKTANVYNNTVIFYTADNGPHQGAERTANGTNSILWSTNFLRQCKASNFEGGIRTPGIIHAPMLIKTFRNVSTVAVTSDFLPTIMDLLGVKTDNPTWAMDGMSLLPYIGEQSDLPRPKPLGFSWGGLHVLIDNDMKLLSKPVAGQCSFQEPYASAEGLDSFYMFNLTADYHELVDLKAAMPTQYAKMQDQLAVFLASVANSQANETHCKGSSPAPAPLPPAPPSTACNFTAYEGLLGSDAHRVHAVSREACCGSCHADKKCVGATYSEGICHIKHGDLERVSGRGAHSVVCVPER